MKRLSKEDQEMELFKEVMDLVEKMCIYVELDPYTEENYNRFVDLRKTIRPTFYLKATDKYNLAREFYFKYILKLEHEYDSRNASKREKIHFLNKHAHVNNWNAMDYSKTIDYCDGNIVKAFAVIKAPEEKRDAFFKHVINQNSALKTQSVSLGESRSVVQQPAKPQYVSTGNKELDGLLLLRANMSCIYGYAKIKSDNIRRIEKTINELDAKTKTYNDRINRAIEQAGGELYKVLSFISSEDYWKHILEVTKFSKKKQAKMVFGRDQSEYSTHQYNLRRYGAVIIDETINFNGNVDNNLKIISNGRQLIQKEYSDIQKAFREFDSQQFSIVPSDYKYLDYLIYLFVSHRASTVKEALNELDLAIRHDELMSSLNKLSNQIAQSIMSLSNQIARATSQINANISYLNSNVEYLNQNVTGLRNDVVDTRNQIIAEQRNTQYLIEEGNKIASLNYEATRKACSSLDSIRNKMI